MTSYGVDPERADVDDVFVEFVVPAEALAALLPERRAARRNRDRIAARRHDVARVDRGRRASRRRGKPVDDVRQRFLMHLFVLEDGEERLGTDEHRIRRIVERRVRDVVDQRGVARFAESGARPARSGQSVRRCLLGRVDRARIDAAFEKQLELRVDLLAVQRAFVQHEIGEARQMAVVEHERMAQRNRRFVVCGRRDRGEERRAARAAGAIAVDECGPVERKTEACPR